MELHLATIIKDKYDRIGVILNELALDIEKIPLDEERRLFRRAFAEVCTFLDEKILLNIIKQYPELDPDRDV